MKSDDVRKKLAFELTTIESAPMRRMFEKDIIDPVRECRFHMTSSGEEPIGVWVIARINDSNVDVAYSEVPCFGADTRIRWGLVSRSDSSCGMSGNWYETLDELIKDCGYYEVQDS